MRQRQHSGFGPSADPLESGVHFPTPPVDLARDILIAKACYAAAPPLRLFSFTPAAAHGLHTNRGRWTQ